MDDRAEYLRKARRFALKGNLLWAQLMADRASEIQTLTPKESEAISKHLVKQGVKPLWQ